MARGGRRQGSRSTVLFSAAAAGAAAGTLTRPAPARSLLMKAVLAATGVGILTASAYVSVPFFPVPLTMQTLAVLLLGGLLGPVVASSSVLSYIAIGAIGAPVFHNGTAGLAVLAGPTAGYLVGFIPAAFLMGLTVRWARSYAAFDSSALKAGVRGTGSRLNGWNALGILAAGAVASSLVIYAVGVPWLAVFTGQGLVGAAKIGLVPFLLGDALKAAVAIGAIRIGGDLLARKGLSLH